MPKILLIDDEENLCGLYATLLERKGYEVLVAQSGSYGLDLYHRARPDLIVLDLRMPDMDGITVLRKLRGMDAQIPVIILSGAGDGQLEQEGRALGAAAFIQKEFSLHRLGDALKRLAPVDR
jgi:two-component system OmpR family response regulator